jgi:hypothetical protein
MGFREDLVRRMDRKRAEIAELEAQIRLAREYLQALEDTLKIVPRDAATVTEKAVSLRPGTSLAKARDAIQKAGRPLHVAELLSAIGKGNTRNDRAGLSGTLAAYVRRGEVFTRPAPNTFGLVGMVVRANEPELEIEPEFPLMEGSDEPVREPKPPSGFGRL